MKSWVEEHWRLAQAGSLVVAGAYLIVPEIASPEMLPWISAFNSYMHAPCARIFMPWAVMSKVSPLAVPVNWFVPSQKLSNRPAPPWIVPFKFLSCCSTRNGMSLHAAREREGVNSRAHP